MGEVWVFEDDERLARQYARWLPLLCAGVVVRSFTNAAAASKALESDTPPDGLILDERLGQDSGLELAEAHREKLRGTRLLFVTGHLTPERSARAAALGAQSLMKPTERWHIEAFARAIARDAAARAEASRSDEWLAERVRYWAEEWDLTLRQTQILRLAVSGKREKEIADEIGISVATVGSHVHELLRRAGFATMRDVVEHVLRAER